MRQVAGKEGVWRLEPREKLLGVKLHAFEGALAPLPDGSALPGVFGIVSGRVLAPCPLGGGMYVVRAEGDAPDQAMRILAYVDRYGRAFACDEPQVAPPARTPDLEIVRDATASGSKPARTTGSVLVRDGGTGPAREVATYEESRGSYSLTNSWYAFDTGARGLPYKEFMTRAFLAFRYRPACGAPFVPSCRVEKLFAEVDAQAPLASLVHIADEVRTAAGDPCLRVPAIVSLFAENLERAGIGRLRDQGVPADALRLVASTSYARMYYLAAADEAAGVSRREVWGLEGALNRLKLSLAAFDALGEGVEACDDERCRAVDAALFEKAGTQTLANDVPRGAPTGSVGGDWDVRCRLSCAIEQLRLPVRVEAEFRLDWAAGEVSLLLTAPDASLMPPSEDPRACALRYAAHVGLLLAARAFELHDTICQVRVLAAPLAEGREARESSVGQAAATPGAGHAAHPDASSAAPEAPAAPVAPAAAPDGDARAYFDVTFARELWELQAHFASALAGDPLAVLRAAGARFDVADAHLPAAESLQPSFEAWRSAGRGERSAKLPPDARYTLGASCAADLNVEYDTEYRRMAEDIAGRLSGVKSATEAIRVVREVSNEAVAARDERAVTACARLMSSLAEGGAGAFDQNAAVERFLGRDRCREALSRAKALEEAHPDQAIAVLSDAISEAQLLDGIADGAEVVYRYFDGYASRVLYNLALTGRFDLSRRVKGDAGKRVVPAPDSFFLCHVEIVRLLEQSFARSDEALRYGEALLALAPAVALSYRVVGRAYMLTGDAERAQRVLKDGLGVALHPTDLALLYYQLAYVLWKVGEPEAAVACYLKSMACGPACALQAMAEMRELLAETGCAIVPHDELDARLAAAGVPTVPDDELLDAFDAAAVAASDAGLAHVARNMLALRLRYRPDDALMGVLRSFGW